MRILQKIVTQMKTGVRTFLNASKKLDSGCRLSLIPCGRGIIKKMVFGFFSKPSKMGQKQKTPLPAGQEEGAG